MLSATVNTTDGDGVYPELADRALDSIHGMLANGCRIFGAEIAETETDGRSSRVVIRTLGRLYEVSIRRLDARPHPGAIVRDDDEAPTPEELATLDGRIRRHIAAP